VRLDRIKLAGFKSFVDPTTIPTPGNLIGIVGPNGCGKSNIIDAVRWVMGESSAKHLRGESMADVIFNGSSGRKPVGLASVELVFDNSEGKAPGEFSKFPEIAIKRQVTRDGQSTYLLNGTRCRRKDITDLFLGTGLGSRSYAIIEQGTISRLIEAKPQELRELIEEAAGISKYKERRHETELRMGHTQENMERLRDLREEVGKQLESLKRQAKKAERFTSLKEQEQGLKEQLLALRWQKHQDEFHLLETRLQEFDAQFRVHAERDFEQSEILTDRREQLEGLQKTLNETQAQFYELGSEISRISQSLRHARETQDNLNQEEARLLEEQNQATTDLEADQERLDEIREELATLDMALDSAIEREIEASEQRLTFENKLRETRSNLETLSRETHRFQSQIELETAKIRQTEQQARNAQVRLEKLNLERTEIERECENSGLEELESVVNELEASRARMHDRQGTLADQIEALRSEINQARTEHHQLLAERHTLDGRIASIETLQHSAMGKDRPALAAWLEKHQLESAPRLAELLTVDTEWETAVENLLGAHLQALCINELSAMGQAVSEIPAESVTLHENRSESANSTDPSILISKLRGPESIEDLLRGIRCAASPAEAFSLRNSLAAGETIISPDGTLVGRHWVMHMKLDDGQAGLIRRERELKDLKQQGSTLADTLSKTHARLEQHEQTLRETEKERDQLQADERQLSAEHMRTRSELSALKSRHEQTLKRLNQIRLESDEFEGLMIETQEALEESRMIKIETEERLSAMEQDLEAFGLKRDAMEADLRRADQTLQSSRDQTQSLKSRSEQLRTSEQMTVRHLERLHSQLEQSQHRMSALKSRATETVHLPEGSEETLETLIETKATVEEKLARERQRTTALEAEIRKASESKLENERQFEKVKEQLERIRLDLSANEVRRQTVEEQFEEIGSNPEQATLSLPPEANEKIWQQQLQEVNAEITRLGAVNLTAMEEFLVQEERMKFLDQQFADLEDSLTTLREAIEKIDRECRSRFKETFDLINSGLQRMFPKLFGGGQASLELTERDLLETGVTVMARPPGKRNSSIHLLSGGEKALTAAALVFAIFELNPAPFCLLDEVDAPLDDANVGRFSQLVKEMSERVQFLFISHNKVTMEIAQHLAGVTMKEPGVSRIVAVDIDAAVEMTAA
jgi:chromosome segregation protein